MPATANTSENSPEQAPEEWRDVSGMEGFYQASDRGRVRRVSYRNGFGIYPLTIPRIMTQRTDKDGYLTVLITLENRWRSYGVYHLVALAFHGKRPSAIHQAAHWDGDKTNNTPSNVRWATPLEQGADKNRRGTTVMGEDCHLSVLSESDIRSIRSRHRRGLGAKLAAEFGVTAANISAIMKRRTWKYV